MVNKGRDKELDRDATEKKHRKTSSTNSNDIPPTKIPKEDVYVVSKLLALLIEHNLIVQQFIFYLVRSQVRGGRIQKTYDQQRFHTFSRNLRQNKENFC